MSMNKFILRNIADYLLQERVFHWKFPWQFRACYIMGQWGQFKVKIATFVYTYFFGIVLLFFIKKKKKKMYYHSYFFFLVKYQISATEY